MKKHLTVALGLAVLATPAFASKARLLALGESTNGSFFIQDNRNIFLNSAEVNNNKDLVTFEFGTGATADTDVAPNAEGGVLKSHNNMVYGLHLGRVTSFNQTMGASNPGTAATTGFYAPSNTIDLFVGGDAGIKWGANLTYANSSDENFRQGAAGAANTADSEAKTLDANVGVIAGDVAAYVKAGIMGESEQKQNTGSTSLDGKFERKSEFEVGASWKMTDYTFFGQVNMNKYEFESADIKNTSYTLGAARFERLNDKTTMFVKLSGSMINKDNEAVNPTDSEVKTTIVPVAVGLEHDAATWLTLRGSISQNLWSKVDSDAAGDSTVANSTNVNAGASLKFGELTVDGVVGTNNGAGTIASTADEKGTLALDNLMTRASVTYRF